MVVVTSGLNWKNEPCSYYLDDNLKKNLDQVKQVVLNKDFDYVAIITGLPGLGKSNFAINCAKYCDPNFTKENICFTADDFINKSETLHKAAIVLDESFASLNSKVTMSKDFLRIINHLQIIRQRNLFIFLCLPNYFDLAKGVAIYRSHHLFVCYGKSYGDRGSFLAFDRDAKKDLFIKGQKFMNYRASEANFKGTFVIQKAIDDDVYRDLKFQHLREQENNIDENKISRSKEERDLCICYMRLILDVPVKTLCEITDMPQTTVYDSINRVKEEVLSKWKKA